MPLNPTLPRDPDQDARTRRFMQQLQQLINALVLAAEVQQTSATNWTIIGGDQFVYAARTYGSAAPNYGRIG